MTTRILPGLAVVAIAIAVAEVLCGRGDAAAPPARVPVLRRAIRAEGLHPLSLVTPTAALREEASARHPPAEGPLLPGIPLLPWSEVVTESGDAVPGALVLLGDLDAPSWSDSADADGRFVLTAFPSYDTLRAVVLKDGEAWIGSTPADGGPFPWTVVVRPPASCYERVVIVRVLDPEGRPVPRATAVPVSGRARGEPPTRDGLPVTRGAFLVPAARWHRGEVPMFLIQETRDEEGHPLPLGEATVAVDPAGPAEVEVRLPAGGLVGGRLLRPDGSPCIGGKVTFRQDPLGALPIPRLAEIDTDAEGRFLFASGPCGGLLEAKDLAGSGPVAAAPGEMEVVLRLREEASLRLLVLDEGGAPVERGHACAEVAGEESRREQGPLAADGTCTLSGLPAGCEVDLSVSAPGRVRHEGRYRVDGSLLRLDLQRAVALSGRVVDCEGQGVPGALVFASAPGDLPVPWRTADLTGADGAFSLHGVPPGAAVRFSVGDGKRLLLEEDVVPGGGKEVLLRLPAAEAFLLVYVDGGDCRSESAAVVLSAGGRVVARGYACNLPALVAFPATDLPPIVDVAVGPTDWYGKQALLRGVASRGILSADMESGTAVRGRVIRTDGGGVAFARGLAEGEGGLSVEFEADGQGEFRAYGLPPGPVVVTVEGFDGSRGTTAAEAPAEGVKVVLEGR